MLLLQKIELSDRRRAGRGGWAVLHPFASGPERELCSVVLDACNERTVRLLPFIGLHVARHACERSSDVYFLFWLVIHHLTQSPLGATGGRRV